jgi:hypothetical protein
MAGSILGLGNPRFIDHCPSRTTGLKVGSFDQFATIGHCDSHERDDRGAVVCYGKGRALGNAESKFLKDPAGDDDNARQHDES